MGFHAQLVDFWRDGKGRSQGQEIAKWELPGEDGDISNLMPEEERPDIESMENEGWIFSQKFDNLEMTEDEAGHEVVVEFVE